MIDVLKTGLRLCYPLCVPVLAITRTCYQVAATFCMRAEGRLRLISALFIVSPSEPRQST